VSEASEIVEQKKIIPLLKTLIEKGIITLEEELKSRYKPKMESCVRLTAEYDENEAALGNLMNALERKAPKQVELLLKFVMLIRNPQKPHFITRAELLKDSLAAPAQLNALVKKGVFEIYETATSRLGQFDSTAEAGSIVFSSEQQQAFDQIRQGFQQHAVTLLHGVTSSGKTEIYIRLMDEVISQGKQALFLLPEIALTTQIINRLRKYFGNRVGVYHSRYNENERVEIWNQVLNWKPGDDATGEHYSIILGARSSLFLPYKELGLVIVDEEHDTSYKQFEPAPRYHARDTAIMLATLHGAKVLVGSATPSIETYHNALQGKFALVSLDSRYGNIQLPQVIIADVKQETRKKRMHSHFTQTLLDHIADALSKKEQVILFQNRRGFSLRLECQECHWMPECKNCDVSLVYHKHNHSARCHYCGYSTKLPERCPSCGSTAILMKGFGTEKVEEDLAVFFPAARIARMDLDTTRSKHAYRQIITDFEERKIDVLVGTQMVTKGLDFDNVSLAGILNADNMLTFPDFRAYERSYQLMAQVSGRAGRKNKRGKVIIQTWNPEHPVIAFVMENNYLGLYHGQIHEREQFRYPPFYRLLRITLRQRDPNLLNEAAAALAQDLRSQFKNMVLGPEYPLVSRIKNLYLKDILFKIPRNGKFNDTKSKLASMLEAFSKTPKFKSVMVSIDVDPM
jgi:primosomal protein N' (replication factor Y)